MKKNLLQGATTSTGHHLFHPCASPTERCKHVSVEYFRVREAVESGDPWAIRWIPRQLNVLVDPRILDSKQLTCSRFSHERAAIGV